MLRGGVGTAHSGPASCGLPRSFALITRLYSGWVWGFGAGWVRLVLFVFVLGGLGFFLCGVWGFFFFFQTSCLVLCTMLKCCRKVKCGLVVLCRDG